MGTFKSQYSALEAAAISKDEDDTFTWRVSQKCICLSTSWMKSHWEPTPKIPGTIEVKLLLVRFKPYSIEGVASILVEHKVKRSC